MSDLNNKTCKELRDIAKEYNITGRWDMTKQELIEAITKASDGSNDKVLPKGDTSIKKEGSIHPEGSQKVTKTTRDYLAKIELGTLIAFKRKKDVEIAMSGKYVGFENGKVLVETKQGTLFKIEPENVVWVKTGAHWPKWVFALFINGKQESEANLDNAIS